MNAFNLEKHIFSNISYCQKSTYRKNFKQNVQPETHLNKSKGYMQYCAWCGHSAIAQTEVYGYLNGCFKVWSPGDRSNLTLWIFENTCFTAIPAARYLLHIHDRGCYIFMCVSRIKHTA